MSERSLGAWRWLAKQKSSLRDAPVELPPPREQLLHCVLRWRFLRVQMALGLVLIART